MSTLPDTPAEPAPMELGRTYQIPHVRAVWPANTPNWVPVLGPRHNDAEIINFKPEHFHIDFRFVTDQMLEEAEALAPKSSIYAISWVYQQVIASLAPETGDDDALARMTPKGELVELHTMNPINAPVESWYQLLPAEYRRVYPDHPTYLLPWMKELEKAYANCRLGPDMKCPHRGTDLTGLEIKNGNTTCPLHGLTWRVKTGRLEPSP